MGWIVSHMKWVMLVCGALTCTMVYAALSPQASLLHTFGETIEGPLAELVVRNWGAVIAMVGGMLIYGAFEPAARGVALVVAGASKLLFIGLVLANGEKYLAHGAGVAVVVDSLMVLLFAWYLIAARLRRA